MFRISFVYLSCMYRVSIVLDSGKTASVQAVARTQSIAKPIAIRLRDRKGRAILCFRVIRYPRRSNSKCHPRHFFTYI